MTQRHTISRSVHAPARDVWRVVADPATWADWGPAIMEIDYPHAAVRRGTTGTVTMLPGVRLPFRIVDVDARRRSWSWRIGRLPAVEHRVTPHPTRRGHCIVSFVAPFWFPGYPVVTRMALWHLAARFETATV